jgi:aspartate aminotransferase
MASIQAPDLLTPTAKGLRLSATLEINELVRQRLDAGKRVVHLGFGEATFPMQKDVLQAHREASSDTSYLPVAGLPALREVSNPFQTGLTLYVYVYLRLYSQLHSSRRAV